MKKKHGFNRDGFLCYVAFYGLGKDEIPGEIGVWELYRRFLVNAFTKPIGFMARQIRDRLGGFSVMFLHGVAATLLVLTAVIALLSGIVTLAVAGTFVLSLAFGLLLLLATLIVAYLILGFLFASRPPRAVDGDSVRNGFLVPCKRWWRVKGHRIYPVWILIPGLFGIFGLRVALVFGVSLWVTYALIRFFGEPRYAESREALYEFIFPRVRIFRNEP